MGSPATFVELTRQKKQLEQELAEIRSLLKQEEQALLEQFASSDPPTLSRTFDLDGERITLFVKKQLWARPTDKRALCERMALIPEMSHLVERSVNTHVLSAWFRDLARQRLTNGEPVESLVDANLDGLVHVTCDYTIGLSGA